MSRLAGIDGDVIRYQIGFATQRKTYTVHGRQFLTYFEACEYADVEGIPQESVKTMLSADIIQAVYHTVDKFIENVLVGAKADEGIIYLTGQDNYRESLATIRPYKGQRSADKPIHYEAITKYLLKVHKAQVIDGAEADDAMGWHQVRRGCDHKSVICTIDKDLDMIPGWHYNWNKQKLYNVSLPEANKFFYTQLLTGDGVDNIEGCPGIGKKTADKILDGATTNLEMYRRCQIAYLDHHRKFAEKHQLTCTEQMLFEGAQRDLEENAHLLWIQREEGVRWEAPSE